MANIGFLWSFYLSERLDEMTQKSYYDVFHITDFYDNDIHHDICYENNIQRHKSMQLVQTGARGHSQAK